MEAEGGAPSKSSSNVKRPKSAYVYFCEVIDCFLFFFVIFLLFCYFFIYLFILNLFLRLIFSFFIYSLF